jgi:beta-lactamase superfamily II metal-dependent hydrolase
MQFQIDPLPIGDKKCGDAIVLRFGDLDSGDPNKQTVVVIDGGYSEDHTKVIDTVRQHYGASKIDLLVSTHAERDHIGGMPGIVENFPVANLWMHLPWEHSADFLAARQEDFSDTKITNKLAKAMRASSDLAAAADAEGIKPEEPFAGKRFVTPFGTITVLGPTQQYYEELVSQIFDKSSVKASLSSLQALLRAADPFVGGVKRAAEAAFNAVESHHFETLTNAGDTGPSNNSSAILLVELADGSSKFLFTGDAGIQALEPAASLYAALGHGPGELDIFQVPHHGSRHNIGPDVLTMFLGDKTSHPDIKRGLAFVSVGANCEADGHPKRVATNAVTRRGYKVWQTKGDGVKFGHPRANWGPVASLPLYESVEADE